MNEPKPVKSKKIWVLFGILTAVVILIAATVMLFISARLQQNALTKAPAYEPATLYNSALQQVNSGDYKAAETSLEDALKQQDDATYRSQLAVVKYRLKKYSEAVTLYQKLIADGKDASFAWNGIGNTYRDWADSDPAQGDSYRSQAINAYLQAITLNAQYVAAYSNLALLYQSQNQTQKAIDILTQGIGVTASPDLTSIKARISQK